MAVLASAGQTGDDMTETTRHNATVQPGGIVEIRSSDLEPGTRVCVIVIPERNDRPAKRTMRSLIGAGKGAFATPEEADAFLRAERDKWD